MAQMNETAVVEVVGIFMTVVNGLGLFILIGIRSDLKDLWKRMYSHYHMIDCNNKGCDARKTGDVIVPHESA